MDENFSGSYSPTDVKFLLKQMHIPTTDVDVKERLIQSGERHYSEMISRESAPGPEYLSIYQAALQAGKARLGADVASLAHALDLQLEGPITLVSLVRAGVPAGILLNRALEVLGRDVAHFGISIIRDKGIDHVALDWILSRRPSAGIVFVDGWTGKGAIRGELDRSLLLYPQLESRLVVLADPCGRAWLSATGDDWLIPSGILGSTVSGLISRSILNDEIGAGDFHGCSVWRHLEKDDRSIEFISTVWPIAEDALKTARPAVWSDADREYHQTESKRVIAEITRRFSVKNPNRIKPGIAEATRALLRRVPERVFVAAHDDLDLQAIIHLAENSGVPVDVDPGIAPYRAVTLIRKTS